MALSPGAEPKLREMIVCIVLLLEAKWKIAALLNTCFEISLQLQKIVDYDTDEQ